MSRFVTFGEIMMRLNPEGYNRFVPARGSNPVTVTIAAQISNVFVLPLTVAAILWLVNRPSVMGAHRAGFILNALLSCAFVFSIVVACTGAKALTEMFLK